MIHNKNLNLLQFNHLKVIKEKGDYKRIKVNPKLNLLFIFLLFHPVKQTTKTKENGDTIKMSSSSRMRHFDIGTQLLDIRNLS
jgi:hypothetical protein